jgi:DNA-binding response OmpR family regulator
VTAPLVLFVEGDPAIRETISLLLERFGLGVSAAADGQAGLDTFRDGAPDAALFDVMLPRPDGVSLTRLIRRISTIPIVLLTAPSDPIDVVAGLEAGADDYLTKPYVGPVLVARLRAVLRRAQPLPAARAGAIIKIGDLEVDPTAMSAAIAGEHVRLTVTEARLLTELARDAGVLLGYDALLERVWEYRWGGDARLVDIHVQRLRAKIGPQRIQTVRRAGYKLALT